MQKKVDVLSRYDKLSEGKLAKVIGGKKKTGIQDFISGLLTGLWYKNS
ncbi:MULTISPECIES: hypothetical protein [Lactobacillaceae]|uniref:Bacteriocin-like peptide n=2 Tax=Levilactobacillus brevis TaxID=1580 RepID=C0SQP4_LEVBR|nr:MULTISPECIES: hypothetical protein [Lactobacillaceae]QCZ54453.1 bacteriocin-like protein [Levilactobacillus brevis]BAH56426.1 hypothetical protein [Levilactobacillus brevis]BAU19438.1 bacteriocin-like peptide [Levilactobacillus brevis]